GELGGEYSHTLQGQELAIHFHGMMAKAADAQTGGTGRNPGPTGVKSLAEGHASKIGGGTTPVNIYSTAAPATALNPGTIGPTRGGQPHDNTQPYLTLSFCIALQGIFPSQS